MERPFAEIRLSKFPDDPFLIAGTDEVIQRHVGSTGEWEPGLWHFIATLLPANPRVVIGGGHVGLSAFQLWKARPDIAELVVFEPDSINAALLTLNVWSWGDSPIRVMPMALGKNLGQHALARNPQNTGDHRLWREATGGSPTGHEIVVVALDDFWSGPLDLLFLDTQGWEPDVLSGATRVILEQRPTIILEWWPYALSARGADPDALITWLERDLRLSIEVVPPEASGVHELLPEAARSLGDVRELTSFLLEQPDPLSAYAELLLRPSDR